jgi:hypothetical protein
VVNKIGRELLAFCKTYSCYIVNGRFGIDSGDFTFINNNGCSVIDYFIATKGLFDVVSNFEVLSNADCCHLPLCMHILSSHQANSVSDRPNESCFYEIDNADTFIESVTEHILSGSFGKLDTMLSDPMSDIDSIVVELESAVVESSAEFKKMKRNVVRKHSKKWYDYSCKKAKSDANRCLKRFRSSRSDHNLLEYVKSKHIYKNVCRRKRLEYNKMYLNKLDSSIHNSRSFWHEIKSFTGRPRVEPNISLEQWYDHFSKLFSPDSDQPINDDIQVDDNVGTLDEIQDAILNSEIMDNEILDAIKSLNVNKSVGGNLLPKQLVYGANVLLPFLCRLFNRLFSKGEFPDKWTQTVIIPLHKKGDVNSANNYRGIALLDVVSKVYIAILTRRVTFYVEIYNKISECQSGFRAGYATVDNAYILYSIVMKYFSMKRKSLYVAFIDFQKAFDSVDHCMLYHVIRENGINGKLFKSIQSIYKTKASVRTSQGITNTFTCPIGLRQG